MTISWQWSVPAGLLPFDTLDRAVEMCAQAGITAIEGQTKAFDHVRDDEQWDTIKRRLKDAGVRVSTFHLPFSPSVDLANLYETQRKAAVAETIRWVEVAARLDCRLGVTHPTTCGHSVDDEGLDRLLDQLSKSAQELLPTLREHGFRVAVENMLPGFRGGRFGSLPEHFHHMAQRLDEAHFGFCLDTGHALVATSPEAVDEFVDVMGQRLIAFHLADNAGDRDSHLAPGRGLVDWHRVFNHMARIGFDGYACIETPPFASGPDYSIKAWRDHLAQATELATASLESTPASR